AARIERASSPRSVLRRGGVVGDPDPARLGVAPQGLADTGARAEEPGHDRADRYVERGRHLLVGELAHAREEERHAVLVGEVVEGLLDVVVDEGRVDAVPLGALEDGLALGRDGAVILERRGAGGALLGAL